MEESDKIEDTDELEKIVKNIIKENKNAVEDFKKGKESSAEFLLGQVMKQTKGKADANLTRDLIKKHLTK